MLVSKLLAGRAIVGLALCVSAAGLAAITFPHTAKADCPVTGCGGGGGGVTVTHTLTIQINGVGTVKEGTTTRCSAASGTNASTTSCTVTYDDGTTPTLTATPASGYGFSGWSGACSGSSCAPAMDSDKSVTATFRDTTPPAAATIITPSANQVIRSDSPVALSFTSSGDAVSTRCAVDNAFATACSSPWRLPSMQTGSHVVHVSSVDINGNLIDVTRSFKYVNMPDTTLSGTPGQGAVVNTLTTDFAYGSPTGVTFDCKLDGSIVPCDADLSSYLTDGAHTLSASAGIEPFGDGVFYFDPTPATRSWTIDTHAPDTAISAGPSGTTTERSASFTFAGTDPAPGTALHYMCRLDGGAWSACDSASGQQYADLPAGAHSFDVEAIDAAGNVDPSPASLGWTVIVDADGDGFYSNTDCDDSNPAIHPGAVDVPGDGIDQDCSGADAAIPAGGSGAGQGSSGSGPSSSGAVLAAKLARSFKLSGKRTLVRRLVLTHVPRGATVRVTCKGRGCPFRSRTYRPKHGSVSLTKAFRHRKLAQKVRLVITVRMHGAKTQTFSISTRAGKKPRLKAS